MLKRSLRDKKRYVVIKMVFEENRAFTIEDLIRTVWKKAYEYGGYLFLARSNLNVVKDLYFKEKNIFFISINPKYVEDLRYIITTIHNIDNINVLMYIIGVSGTIKSALNKYVLRR